MRQLVSWFLGTHLSSSDRRIVVQMGLDPKGMNKDDYHNALYSYLHKSPRKNNKKLTKRPKGGTAPV